MAQSLSSKTAAGCNQILIGCRAQLLGKNLSRDPAKGEGGLDINYLLSSYYVLSSALRVLPM